MNGDQKRAERARGAVSAWCVALALAASSGACAPANASAPRAAARAPALNVAMPGPSPRGRSAEAASALNATCTGCHREIAAEWRASFHASSERDAAYQRAFALEPLPFCQGCHAPETSAFSPVPEAAADVGVGCVTCHVVGEHVLAATRAAGTTSATNWDAAPHALTRAPEFAGVGACATCHEFAFPDAALRAEPELMQATAREHAQSGARGTACATCHMPSVGEGAARHLSHAFPGGHDADFVKGALRVQAERCQADRVCLVLTATSVGHALPTGDLFRRLEVSAEAIGSDDQVVGSARRYLSRHWADERKLATVVRRVTKDDRATNTPLHIELSLTPEAAPSPIAWRVTYQRVDHPRSESEADSVVDGEIEIASGALPPLHENEENHAHP